MPRKAEVEDDRVGGEVADDIDALLGRLRLAEHAKAAIELEPEPGQLAQLGPRRHR